MPITKSEKLIAYLTLFSGLLISGVAEFYSIVGLTAIFPTAFIPIVIMGIALGVGKLVATVWLKQNWSIAPLAVKGYLLTAIAVLMLITSMGIFGFLSKAHSDQGLISGDSQAKLAIYDEKIKIAKENIDANRRALKQLDEAVDQVMGRSTTETGADKAVAIRRGQAKERSRLLQEITAEQKVIAKLNEERAPFAAEVRKVEAEVGPIKYIAKLIYDDNPDANLLEKAVSWVIVLIVIVFDPLAVILLLSSQISFQNFREREQWNFERNLEEAADAFNDVFADELNSTDKTPEELMGEKPDAWVADVGEKPTAEELRPEEPAPHHPDTHPYLRQGFKYPPDWERVGPMVYRPDPIEAVTSEVADNTDLIDALEGAVNRLQEENDQLRAQVLAMNVEKHGYSSNGEVVKVADETYDKNEFNRLMSSNYVQNEEQKQSGLWNKIQSSKRISEEEYLTQSRKKNDNTDNAS